MLTVTELADKVVKILDDFIMSRDCTCDDDSWECWYRMDSKQRNDEFKDYVRHSLLRNNDWNETVELVGVTPYPAEELRADEDDGTMPESRAELEQAVVGHRIVSVESHADEPYEHSGSWRRSYGHTIITLDNGKKVVLGNTDDCCAYTQVEAFLLNPNLVDHMIMGVGTTDGYTRWHIYADLGDILELTVGWSCGNPFYYGYGFYIDVIDAEENP